MPTDPKRLMTSRILAVEWARRSGPPAGDDWPAELAGLPPVSVLAARAFPGWVLERRLRFWAATGRRPGPELGLERLDDLDLPGGGPEDWAAWVHGARLVRTGDEFVAGLARALGRACEGPETDPDGGRRLDQFLDRWSGPPGPPPGFGVPPPYGRLEAATVAGDRFFGRRGPGPAWEGLFRAVGWAGRVKRRARP